MITSKQADFVDFRLLIKMFPSLHLEFFFFVIVVLGKMINTTFSNSSVSFGLILVLAASQR